MPAHRIQPARSLMHAHPSMFGPGWHNAEMGGTTGTPTHPIRFTSSFTHTGTYGGVHPFDTGQSR